MKTVSINIYSFSELNERAQHKAVKDHREFLLSTMRPEDFISGCPEYDTPKELRKAYESEYDYYLINDEPIIESIEANDYMFYANGDIDSEGVTGKAV